MRKTGKLLIFLLIVTCWSWATAALFFAGPNPLWLRSCLTLAFAGALPLVYFLGKSFSQATLLLFFALGGVLFWWTSLTPTNEKDWARDVSRISHGLLVEDTLTLYNVRNFKYHSETDFIENWETRRYDLSQLQGLDIFLSYWASEHIAHTIISWDFGDSNHLAISIETRKDKTQEYSAVKGFFKQFELAYIAADELDIIKLRTNYRKERVYRYRLLVAKSTARALLESYLQAMNALVDQPRFYDALTQNCTTTIHLHSRAISPSVSPLPDWRLLASGHLDKLLYERGLLVNKRPFTELRAASRIDLRMQQYGGDNFSRELRIEEVR